MVYFLLLGFMFLLGFFETQSRVLALFVKVDIRVHYRKNVEYEIATNGCMLETM